MNKTKILFKKKKYLEINLLKIFLTKQILQTIIEVITQEITRVIIHIIILIVLIYLELK